NVAGIRRTDTEPVRGVVEQAELPGRRIDRARAVRDEQVGAVRVELDVRGLLVLVVRLPERNVELEQLGAALAANERHRRRDVAFEGARLPREVGAEALPIPRAARARVVGRGAVVIAMLDARRDAHRPAAELEY